ncbi:CLUMA_CG004344, isoform A [Clunio marinus]|uniref:Peptidyl-prolyl cis-trans isomerase n=1 Tax=Clunio marinus TaxID=568069 RepID=A0A1J1HSW9_9DIPT|nr:CLUMA_CG004344, isoform A [Clunio marinus]
MSVVIETTIGDITVDLFLKERPKACLNFLKLCKLKYYNFNLFHTIQQNFIAQTGDPTGDGDKGESFWGVIHGPSERFFEAENIPKILHSEPGLLSMVSDGKSFIGSQFLFTLGPDLSSLDNIHCVIGEVVEGHEVLRQLNETIVDENFRPFKDIRITHTVVLDDPFSDPRGFRQPSRSPSPSAERLKNGRIAADEEIDDAKGKTEAEVIEMVQEREAKARATILEIVGDIPDADIAPPENVLFVCKLNPVTTEDDLKIIFGRYGKVKSCEVIRDKVSGESLQYAFVEFENTNSCEQAYFSMDMALIDDRRVHVDFSQSVTKVKWRGKGNYTIYDRDAKFLSQRSDGGRNNSRRQDSRQDRNRYDDRNMTNRRRDRDQRRDFSPVNKRRSRSRSRDRQRRRFSPKRNRLPSPSRHSRKRRSRSRSNNSDKSRDERKKKSHRDHKKKSSKKERKHRKKRSSSSSSSSSNNSMDRKKKSRK